MISIALLKLSSRGILVNKLVTSKDIRNLPYVLSCLVSSMKVKLSRLYSLREYVVNLKIHDIERVYNYKYL